MKRSVLSLLLALCFAQPAKASCVFESANSEYLFTNTAPLTALPFSIVGWFKSNNETADQVIGFLGDKDVLNMYHALFANGAAGGDGIVARSRDAGANDGSSDGNYAAATWTHAAGVWTSTTDRKSYLIGGTPATNATSINPTGIDRFAIGAFATSSAPPTLGFITSRSRMATSLISRPVDPKAIAGSALVSFYRCFDNANDRQGSNNLSSRARSVLIPATIQP